MIETIVPIALVALAVVVAYFIGRNDGIKQGEDNILSQFEDQCECESCSPENYFNEPALTIPMEPEPTVEPKKKAAKKTTKKSK